MNEATKVLMIANFFPPMGGSGVQRTLKFVKHLGKFGYEPIVLTRRTENIGLRDESLMADIPDGTVTVRTRAYDFTEWKGIFRLFGKAIAKFILIPDGERVWAEHAKKEALRIVLEQDIKIIYTTSAPYSDHLIGRYVKKKAPHVKWVADFRDEWTNNPYTLDNPHNPLRTYIEKKMERDVLLDADILIANTPVMRRNFIVNNGLREDNFYSIPNGYDEEDFKDLDNTPRKNDRFTLVYTGLLYGRRKPDTLFEAISALVKEGLIDPSRISLRLIGNYKVEQLRQKIDGCGISGQIEIVGYLPHKECIEEQLASDALVLIEGSGRGSDAFYTGKIFEYMNTGRPVLAFLPKNGAAWELVLKTKLGLTADVDDVPGIKENLLLYYRKWIDNDLDFAPDTEEIKKFERKQITKQLAELFDSLLQ